MSSSPPEDPQPSLKQKLYEEARQRQLFKDKCWDVIKTKWTQVREDYSIHWNGPDAQDFAVEKKIVREHVEVFEHGVVMALVVFGSLRLTAHPKFEYVAEKYIKPFFRITPPAAPKKKSIAKPPPPPQSTAKPKLVQPHHPGGMRPKSYLEKQRDTHVEKIHQMAEAPHDFMVGTICGLSAIFLFIRPKQWRLDFEEAPLTGPGRSLWSENLCPDFIRILQETDPQVFDFEDEEKVDANVQSFQKFALHCQLRGAYIQKRKEQGVENPLSLPTHGPWKDEME